MFGKSFILFFLILILFMSCTNPTTPPVPPPPEPQIMWLYNLQKLNSESPDGVPQSEFTPMYKKKRACG